MTDTHKLWRTGLTNNHAVLCGDEFRGMFDRHEDAKAVVEAMNARRLTRDEAIALVRSQRVPIDVPTQSQEAAYTRGMCDMVDALVDAGRVASVEEKPVAPPNPQAEPGRWLYEQVLILEKWRRDSLKWEHRSDSEREAWAKVEAECMARGDEKLNVEVTDARLALELDGSRSTRRIADLEAERDSLRAQIEDLRRRAPGVEWRQGMEDGDMHCTICGAVVEESKPHAAEDCKAELDGAESSVFAYLTQENARLDKQFRGMLEVFALNLEEYYYTDPVAAIRREQDRLKSELADMTNKRDALRTLNKQNFDVHGRQEEQLRLELNAVKGELAAMTRVAEERQTEAEAWRSVGDFIAEADPAHATTSPAHAKAVIAGIRQANKGLRERVESEGAKMPDVPRAGEPRIMQTLRMMSGGDPDGQKLLLDPLQCRDIVAWVDRCPSAPVPPAAVPDGGSDEDMGHVIGMDLNGNDYCESCGTTFFNPPKEPCLAAKQPTPDKTTPPRNPDTWCASCKSGAVAHQRHLRDVRHKTERCLGYHRPRPGGCSSTVTEPNDAPRA
jgi:uncharacterized Zn finger protein (UPF0148 family)